MTSSGQHMLTAPRADPPLRAPAARSSLSSQRRRFCGRVEIFGRANVFNNDISGIGRSAEIRSDNGAAEIGRPGSEEPPMLWLSDGEV